MTVPQDLRYSKEHEWVRLDGDTATIGITHFAQEQLGDVVFVDVPQAGRTVAKGESVAVVESVKAASDIYSPASGEVTEANAALMASAPSFVSAWPSMIGVSIGPGLRVLIRMPRSLNSCVQVRA